MSRLIIVSNRVSMPQAEGAQGGLAVALQAALRESGGIWFGWSGEQVEKFTGQVGFQEADGVRCAVVDLEEQDVDEYYNGYANRTLWPLMHYRVDLAEYSRHFGEGYERVNSRFADTLSVLVESDDLIWVHDYHLMPLAWMLREKGSSNRMGFFLHTPWPPTRLLVSLPHHDRLVRSLFSYDVLGFQTDEWLDSFRHYCETEMGGTVDGDWITVDGRTIRAIACPIGIDAEEFIAASQSKQASDANQLIRASLQDRTLIIGVDRLDYSKGLEERLESYERLLKTYPETHRNVVMLQVAPPSRGAVESYRLVRLDLEGQAGRINGAFAHVDWTPIRYVNRGYPRAELAGLYRAARIGLVTPLRDGMNLVAKEYVAAQDPDDPGVLILSRFAGAAHQLDEALLVNPYAREEVADAINRALHMSKAERKDRWKSLIKGIKEQDVMWWRRQFVELLEGIVREEDAPKQISVREMRIVAEAN
jgi:trehalose 6-phosphate synthase